ncbi:hypothetical protein AB0M28_38250 [Streptomyces sp. NPDC051940]|uniref:LppU/SCO3897 family protein n=1 Tax=Streptomyces sp. NPDC051940 TaxID=3155675 RepID=UPI0034312DEE
MSMPQPPQGGNPFANPQDPQGGNPYAAPQGQPGDAPAGGLVCGFCGAAPAVKATVRGHQGLIVRMRFLKLEQAYCRTCGIATVRSMSAKTLLQGWWGFLSLVVAPVTLLGNLVTKGKFTKLAEPSGGWGPPLDPGKPLLRRGAAIGLLIPVVLVGLLVTVIALDDSAASAEAGDCAHRAGARDLEVVDCGAANADYVVLARIDGDLSDAEAEQKCTAEAPESELFYKQSGSGSDFVLCLKPH